MSEIKTAPTETFVDRVFSRPVCEDAESTAGRARSARASESNQNQQNRARAPAMTSRRRSPRNRSRDSSRDMDRRFELLSQQLKLMCCAADVLEGKGTVQVAITVTELLRRHAAALRGSPALSPPPAPATVPHAT